MFNYFHKIYRFKLKKTEEKSYFTFFELLIGCDQIFLYDSCRKLREQI